MNLMRLTLKFSLFVLSVIGSAQSAMAIVPHPGCYDRHGCVDPNSTPQEQRAQNEANWRRWGYVTPPDAYGHTAAGYTYIVFGDSITVTRPDGTEGTVGELIDHLPDCAEGWRDRAGDAGAVTAIIGGIGVFIPPVMPLAGEAGIGAGVGWLYCRIAEGT